MKRGLLLEDTKLFIRPADKGGGTVLLNYSDYRDEIMSQLADKEVYKSQVDAVIDKAFDDHIINITLRDYLKQEYPICPILYTLPKVHKNMQKPLGCPMVSRRGSLHHPICMYLDTILQRVVQSTPTYLRDTPYLLECLRSLVIPKRLKCWMASLDVVSLYTCIPHEAGVEAVKRSLEAFEFYEGPNSIYFGISKTGTNNELFSVQKNFFLQVAGTAMGAAMHPHTPTFLCISLSNAR